MHSAASAPLPLLATREGKSAGNANVGAEHPTRSAGARNRQHSTLPPTPPPSFCPYEQGSDRERGKRGGGVGACFCAAVDSRVCPRGPSYLRPFFLPPAACRAACRAAASAASASNCEHARACKREACDRIIVKGVVLAGE